MVYGDFQRTPADEECPKKSRDLYGGMKYAGEILVESFSRRMGVEYAIVRPSAVYGPTDVNRRVSQLFVEKALRGEPLELRGGDVTLDFSYVKDTASGIVLAAKHPNGANQAFNITYGQGRTLKEYIEILRTLIPNIQVVETPAETHRPKRGSLDITKARNLLGYVPEYPLEVGLPLSAKYLLALVKSELFIAFSKASMCPALFTCPRGINLKVEIIKSESFLASLTSDGLNVWV